MTIQFAILGLLSWKPFSGYELKKLISDSAVMYWSGNNNQIYRSLIELLKEGLVTQEVQYQESSPMKKVYSITEKGLGELKKWILTIPELPEYKNTFLIQLAWADLLNPQELSSVLEKYEQEIHMQLLMLQEKARRGTHVPNRTGRETYLWEMISQNIINSYQNELAWVRQVRQEVQAKEDINMDFWVKKVNDCQYIECIPGKRVIANEQDAVDLIAVCGENDTNRLMLHSGNLPEAFFDLKTGLAGMILQKFVNYQIKVVAIMQPEMIMQGRFKEMINEANRGKDFRVFSDYQGAVEWLVNN